MIKTLIASITAITERIIKKKLKDKELQIELDKIRNQVEQFEKTYNLEYINSPVGIAERKSKIKATITSCKKCNEMQWEKIKVTLETIKKHGTTEQQIMSGKSFINSGPEIEYENLITRKKLCPCTRHKPDAYLLGELNKINNNN